MKKSASCFRLKSVISAMLLTAGTLAVSSASAQSGDGWVTLLDSKNMGTWNQLGKTNWRMEEGAAVADKKTSKGPAYLVSTESYEDFQLYVEFYASDDANSGIFFRCADPTSINDKLCYEANIFDQRKDPSYGTGGIVRHAEVNPMPKAGGKWNTYEISVKGRDISVMLNGEKTAQIRSGMFVKGPFALQHGAGTIKFRKVAIKPISSQ